MTDSRNDPLPPIEPIPLRLMVGIVGHKNLHEKAESAEDLALLKAAVKQVIQDLLKQNSAWSDAPARLCLLSTLGAGTNRLVVKTAMEFFQDVSLKVILPLQKADYLEDFSDDAAILEFEALFSSADSVSSVTRYPLDPIHFPADQIKEARKHGYKLANRFIVDHCDVLLAIWDGTPDDRPYSIETILSYAKSTDCPIRRIHPKSLNPSIPPDISEDKASYIQAGRGFTSATKHDRSISDDLRTFNKRLSAFQSEGDFKEKIQQEYDNLFADRKLPPGWAAIDKMYHIQETIRAFLLPYFVLAEASASGYQRIFKRTGTAAFWLAFSAVFLVGIGVVYLHSPSYIFFVEMIILITISGLIYYADRIKRSHKNWMEFRFLAERLRTSIFFAACGFRMQPRFTKQRAGGDSRITTGWVERVLEEIWRRVPAQKTIHQRDCDILAAFVEKAWIEEQMEYHRKSFDRNFEKSEHIERTGEFIFYLAIAAACIHLWISHESILAKILTILALTLPALAATFEGIRFQREYKRIAIRSSQMQYEIERIKGSFILLTPDKLESLLEEAENLMLKDTGDWLSLMRFAELYKVV